MLVLAPVFSREFRPEQAQVTEIASLSSRDAVFSRYMQEVENAYRCIASGREVPLAFYSYTAGPDDTLLHIAARCTVPYEAIALLNGIGASGEAIDGRVLVLPNAPGLFVPETPTTPIGTLVKKRLYTSDPDLCYNVMGRMFQYAAKERLTPTERAFFLDATLRMPLEESVLTSSFGMRTSPISGDLRFHKGIDLAAPEGTDVLSCKAGIVANAAWDDVYGNFIIMDHDNSTQSVYAHLSKILVRAGEIVSGGAVIGRVGTTGASTGPHLHFEIRVNGAAQDPRRLLPVL